jgi:hypothetical protein
VKQYKRIFIWVVRKSRGRADFNLKCSPLDNFPLKSLLIFIYLPFAYKLVVVIANCKNFIFFTIHLIIFTLCTLNLFIFLCRSLDPKTAHSAFYVSFASLSFVYILCHYVCFVYECAFHLHPSLPSVHSDSFSFSRFTGPRG